MTRNTKTRKSRWTPLLIAMIVFSASVARAQSGDLPDGRATGDLRTRQRGAASGHRRHLDGHHLHRRPVAHHVRLWRHRDLLGARPGPHPTRVDAHFAPRRLGSPRRKALWLDDVGHLLRPNHGPGAPVPKIRSELTLGSDDEMSARSQVEVLNLQGEVVLSRSATVTFRRIQYEPLD